MEDPSLELLVPAPEERLHAWLTEFYGKPVHVLSRETLRHRDLSFVQRIRVAEALPASLIYKVVLPPWDIEQDLHERVLIPSISHAPQLYLTAHHGKLTAMFLEDLGSHSLKGGASPELAAMVGKELAKLHRGYCYRADELIQTGVLKTLYPIDYEDLAAELAEQLVEWGLITGKQARDLKLLANLIAPKLAGEPICLVHGDLYAENLILHTGRLFIIDWSWFTHLGVPMMDLATVTMDHIKNGQFVSVRAELLDAYCFESGRNLEDVMEMLPAAETLSRVLFLDWLVERRRRGIMGTTVGPVDELIPKVVDELSARLSLIPA